MKRIKFTERAVFEQFGPGHPDNPVFESGGVYTLLNEQAERWLRRAAAELIEELGADTFDGADPARIAQLRAEVERRFEVQIAAMTKDLADGRDQLAKSIAGK